MPQPGAKGRGRTLASAPPVTAANRPRAANCGLASRSAVVNIGEAMGLDYSGVDFSLTSDGRVLVFEANAAMCVHTEPEDSVFAAKNPYVTPILKAFQRMLTNAAVAPDRV